MSNLDPENLLPGTFVAGYEVKSLVRHTHMGTIYQAMQKSLNRPVALKILSKEISSQESFAQTYLQSARNVASLTHLNVVQLFEAGTTPEGLHFLAMELVPGRDLSSVLDHNEKIPLERTIEIMSGIASALEHAWDRHQLIHGDVNPANITLRNDGVPKLAEVGLAKADFNSQSTSRDIFVTPLYASPEVILGKLNPNDPRSDIYSFGCTLFHLLVGVPPFTGTDPEFIFTKHLEVEPQSILTFRDGIPPEIVTLVHRMLQKDPDLRPATWNEVTQVFKDFLTRQQQIAPVAVAAHAATTKSTKSTKKSKKLSGKPTIKPRNSAQGRGGASRKGSAGKSRVAAPPKSGNGGIIAMIVILAVVVIGGIVVLSQAESMKVNKDWLEVEAYLQSNVTLSDKRVRVSAYIRKFGAKANPQAVPTEASLIKEIAEAKEKKDAENLIKSKQMRKINFDADQARLKAERLAREAKKKSKKKRR